MQTIRLCRTVAFLGICLTLLAAPWGAAPQSPVNIPLGGISGSGVFPGYMFYQAPCGIYFVQGWMTPPVWMGTLPGNATPLIENCAVSNELIGNGANVATPALTQPNQNLPLSIEEISTSGSMLFNFLVEFRDSTDTQFNGRYDVEIDIPYDESLCIGTTIATPYGALNISGLIPGPTNADGLQSYTDIPLPCALVTPPQFQSAINSGHIIGWTLYDAVSQTLYGPTSPTPSGTSSAVIQSPGGLVFSSVAVPYQTEISATVVRVGMRFSEGYGNQMPISFGCGSSPCSSSSDEILPLYNGAMQGEWVFSQPFTVQIQPMFLVQYHTLPVFILYQPPGDQSSSSFEMLSTYTQQYTSGTTVSLTDSTEFDQKTTTDTTFGEKASDPYASVNGTFTVDNSFDANVKQTMGASYGNSTGALISSTFSQTYTTPKLTTSATPATAVTFYEQPFWSDTVYFLLNPQFAIWEYPNASGTVSAFSQPLGAATIWPESVQQLSKCAGSSKYVTEPAQPINLTYGLDVNGTSQTFQFTLSGSDCVNLLQLDPFWVALTQAATPPMGLPIEANNSLTLSTNSAAYNQTQVSSSTTGTQGSQTFNATVTGTEANTKTGGVTDSLFDFVFGVSASTAFTNGDGQQFQIQLSSTASQTAETSVSSTITLQDCPALASPGSSTATDNCSKSETPLSVLVYQDSRFLTMMAQTPTLSIPYPWPSAVITNPSGGVVIRYPVTCTACLAKTGYGFLSGQFPSPNHQLYDPSLIKVVSTTAQPISGIKQINPVRIPAPIPAPRKPNVVAMLPIAYTKAPPAPQNLTSELPQIVAKFPNAEKVVKPPAGYTYPASGVLQMGAKDGRPQLVQPK